MLRLKIIESLICFYNIVWIDMYNRPARMKWIQIICNKGHDCTLPRLLHPRSRASTIYMYRRPSAKRSAVAHSIRTRNSEAQTDQTTGFKSSPEYKALPPELDM